MREDHEFLSFSDFHYVQIELDILLYVSYVPKVLARYTQKNACLKRSLSRDKN